MATKVTVQSTLFLYTDPDSGSRRWARKGDEITVNDKDLARLKSAERTTAPTAPTTNANNDPYDEMKVAEAIEFLEALPEDQREPYFEKERASQRKGVLDHFDESYDF